MDHGAPPETTGCVGVRLRAVAGVVAAVVVAGLLSGLAASLLTVALLSVEHLALGYREGSLGAAFAAAPLWRRALAPAVGALLAGLGWWLLRRRTVIAGIEQLSRASPARGEVGWVVADALLQILVVGSGASIGREGAPRQAAAGLTARVVRGFPLDPRLRRVLVVSAAGAGLAAVYTTPVAGALFAVELTLGMWDAGTIVIAMSVSGIATLAAWPVTHDAATYAWPGGAMTPATIVWILLAGPCTALLGALFRRLTDRATAGSTRTGPGVPLRLAGAGLVLGVVSWWLPAIPGNGKPMVEQVLTGSGTLATLGALTLAKPLLTALFLRAGATGGLLTPALATGAALGAFASSLAHLAGWDASTPVWAVIGAAGVLAVTQRGAWFAAVFVMELTRPGYWLIVPLLVVALVADRLARIWTVTRLIDPKPARQGHVFWPKPPSG